MSDGSARRRRSRGRRRFAPAALLVGWVAATILAGATATTAVAAPAQFAGTDPAGDSGTPAATSYDLTATKWSYDAGAGTFSISIETVAAPLGTDGTFSVFAAKAQNGGCSIDPETGDGAVFGGSVAWTNLGNIATWILLGTDTSGDITASRSGTTTTLSIAADPALKALDLDCAVVAAKSWDGTSFLDGDVITALATSGATTAVKAAPPPPVFTTEPDADGDGIPDAVDRCQTVAGAATTGCLTIPSALAARLGAKRVAVDQLVRRTAAVCPASARARVTSIGKTVGTGTLAVSTHGAYCRVYGQVRLKRRFARVRLRVTAPGMTGIGRSLRR